jgi:hypothetical protein
MELPHPQTTHKTTSPEELPLTLARWKMFPKRAPIAAAFEEDCVSFSTQNHNFCVEFSSSGLNRAVYFPNANKIYLNRPATPLNSGTALSLPEEFRTGDAQLIDIHLIDDRRLVFVSMQGITLYDLCSLNCRTLAFNTGYQLARIPYGRCAKQVSYVCSDNEIVFATHAVPAQGASNTQYVYRIMFHSDGTMRVVAQIPMKKLWIRSLMAASPSYTVVIKNACMVDPETDTKSPKIKLFTTEQLEAVAESDRGISRIKPKVTAFLPNMPIHAAIISPDEQNLYISWTVALKPAILVAALSDTGISFIKQIAAPLSAVWSFYWPKKAKGPYLSLQSKSDSYQLLVNEEIASTGKRPLD